jgi:maleate isomerase
MHEEPAVPDAVGYRAKFGVIIPSTNTVVEHDYSLMRPEGVTFHYGRMYIANAAADSDEAFEQLIQQIRSATETAVRDVMTAKPDAIIMGMSAETFWGGQAGNERFTARIEEQSGLQVATGADACGRACRALGISRVGVLTPYQPVGDGHVRTFFGDIGLDVVRLRGLRCASATAIAEVEEPVLRQALQDLDGDDVDALIQVGTNLSMLRLADEAERWLGKPVLAINAVTMWHALRSNGVHDRAHGFGTLLKEH